MKNIITILILLFVVGSLSAQTYSISPSFDSMQVNALKMLNIISSGNGYVTTPQIKYVINLSIGEICDAFPALEKVDTVVVWRDSAGFDLNADFLRIKSVFRIDQAGDDGDIEIWTPINYIPYDSLAIIFDSRSKNVDDKSKIEQLRTSYTWGRQLRFHPKNYSSSANPDSFVVYYYARDVFLVNGTDSTSIAPEYMGELMNYIKSEIKILQEEYKVSDFYLGRYNASAVTPKPREVDLKR